MTSQAMKEMHGGTRPRRKRVGGTTLRSKTIGDGEADHGELAGQHERGGQAGRPLGHDVQDKRQDFHSVHGPDHWTEAKGWSEATWADDVQDRKRDFHGGANADGKEEADGAGGQAAVESFVPRIPVFPSIKLTCILSPAL